MPDMTDDDVQGLLFAASEAVNWLGRMQWAPGSAAANEVAADQTWATSDFERPAFNTNIAVSVYLQAAGDHLRALGETFHGNLNLAFSPGALARAVCETTAIAWWLADPTIARKERLTRFLRIHRTSCLEERKLYEQIGMNRAPTREVEWARWAEGQGINPNSAMPAMTDLFGKVAQQGRATYRLLSSVTHAPLFALWGTWKMAARGQHRILVWSACYEALAFAFTAIDAVSALWGRTVPLFDELESGLEAFHAVLQDMGLYAAERGWRRLRRAAG
jgi:hypothetical protein